MGAGFTIQFGDSIVVLRWWPRQGHGPGRAESTGITFTHKALGSEA